MQTRAAVVRVAEGCKVKKTIAQQPPITVSLAPASTSVTASAPPANDLDHAHLPPLPVAAAGGVR